MVTNSYKKYGDPIDNRLKNENRKCQKWQEGRGGDGAEGRGMGEREGEGEGTPRAPSLKLIVLDLIL